MRFTVSRGRILSAVALLTVVSIGGFAVGKKGHSFAESETPAPTEPPLSPEVGSVLGATTTLPAMAKGVTPDRQFVGLDSTRLADALQKEGTLLNSIDQVRVFPPPSLGIGSEVLIYRAPRVVLADGTKAEATLATWSATVGEVLTETETELGSSDRITPALDTPIPAGGTAIAITRVESATTSITKAEPFASREEKTDTLFIGKSKVSVEGKAGVRTITYKIVRENGKQVSKTEVSNVITTPPVTKVTLVGTKVPPPVLVAEGTGQASWYDAPASSLSQTGNLTAAHKTLAKGTKVKVVNVANGKSVIVTITDRGPFIAGRVIDLSTPAFSQLASTGTGVISVRLEAIE